MIKILVGIRRCGKSVILNQIIDEIKEKGKNIIYLNFEDKRIKSNIINANALIEYIEKNRKEGKCYIFLDEIQELDGWQDTCKTLRLFDNSIFITDSNSKLLSREFTKEHSGRYVSFRIRPFVYKEIKEYCKELGIEYSISYYLIWGGFPKRFEFDSVDARLGYLNDLDDTIVINDLINRYHIKKERLSRNMEKTYIYIIRHSEVLKIENNINYVNEDDQIRNEKIILSVDGERKAEKLSKIKELKNLDMLWSSNYVRAISTAKYLSLKNNIKINIDENFNERKIRKYK